MANKRIDELTAGTVGTTILSADVVETIHDPAGTPASYKATLLQLLLAADNPCCSVSLSSAQALTTGVAAALVLDAADTYDTDAMHDPASNNTRVIAKTAGAFLFAGDAIFAGSAVGIALLVYKLNGTTQLAAQVDVLNSVSCAPALCLVQSYKLAVNDYIELLGYQTSGGNLNVTVATIQAHRIGKG